MRRQLGIEHGTTQGPFSGGLDLTAALAMSQIGRGRDDARWQRDIPPLLGLGLLRSEDHPPTVEADIAPIEFEGFGHSHAGSPSSRISEVCRCGAAAAIKRSASSGSK